MTGQADNTLHMLQDNKASSPTTGQSETEGQTALVVVEDVYKRYNAGEVEALRGVTLHIERSAFIAITGPSGSGKSTLLRIIASLDQPTSGSVIIDGIDIHTLSGEKLAAFRREYVGLIFQRFRLLPSMNVLENVMAPFLPNRPARQLRGQAEAMLERVHIAHRARHLPGELSGGEQQRVAIARALIANPHLLLADEPTGSLDTTTSATIIDLLQEIQASDAMTLLVVTHDPRIAARAQRSIAMEDGRIVIGA